MPSKEAPLRSSVAVVGAMLCAACALIHPPPAVPVPARLDEGAIRQFAAEQQAAWNAHDLDRFYALCASDAVFVSVTWNSDGTITREQRSVADERAAADLFFANHPGKFSEIDAIDGIKIAPDGLSARILGHQTARYLSRGRVEVLHASTDQTVVFRDGRPLSMGQVATTER